MKDCQNKEHNTMIPAGAWTKLTYDQAVFLPFLFWRQGEKKKKTPDRRLEPGLRGYVSGKLPTYPSTKPTLTLISHLG